MHWLVGIIVEKVIGKIVEFLSSIWKKWQMRKENHQKQVDQAAQDMQKAKDLKPDSTAQQTDEAIDDSLKHF